MRDLSVSRWTVVVKNPVLGDLEFLGKSCRYRVPWVVKICTRWYFCICICKIFIYSRVLYPFVPLCFCKLFFKMIVELLYYFQIEKESYRIRAREITDQRMGDWRNKMKSFSQQNQLRVLPTAIDASKRRRTHGYAIFSSEMRKKVAADNLSMTDSSKAIAEEWRNISAGSFSNS